MGYLVSLFSSTPQANYAPHDDFWYKPIPWQAGTGGPLLDAEAALHVSAFFAGVKILSETLAQVPLILYQRGEAEGEKSRANQNLLYWLLHDQPNNYQTSYEFRLQQMMSILLWGNAYAQIVSSSRGAVTELNPLVAARMRPVKVPNNRIGYLYRNDDGIEQPFIQDEIFHLRGFPLAQNGLVGQSVIGHARESLELAMSTASYGNRLFSEGAMHRGAFSVPGSLLPKQREAIREEIKRVHAGVGGWHSTMVLEAGAKWETMSMNADDAQFLLTRKFEIIEVARWLNIPPHMLKDLERATFSNIEHQQLEFLQITMLPYFVNWEQAILRDLIVQKNRFFAEFLVDGLVRADINTRYQAYGTAINTGFMTRNEVRLKENLEPKTGLDLFLVDQNRATVDDEGNIEPINQQGTPNRQSLPPAEETAAGYWNKLLVANARQVLENQYDKISRTMKKEMTPEKLRGWADKFYGDYADVIGERLQLGEKESRQFAQEEKERFLVSHKDNSVGQLLAELKNGRAYDLAAFARRMQNGKSDTSDLVPS